MMLQPHIIKGKGSGVYLHDSATQQGHQGQQARADIGRCRPHHDKHLVEREQCHRHCRAHQHGHEMNAHGKLGATRYHDGRHDDKQQRCQHIGPHSTSHSRAHQQEAHHSIF